ncbi:hypothetical protein NIES21_59190 (plasmid) [Anabaenopsis circularis NIES-21]|uniref:Uncharacterized protein n=1 Tax=Anabaenopsis circularis NIES-21 TaxID=1085406 RepID=A0A1Z4GRC7_9CYAN|nr:hypothetical protein NIES21_59190 [Anabaenopsis circularis NIES-21]
MLIQCLGRQKERLIGFSTTGGNLINSGLIISNVPTNLSKGNIVITSKCFSNHFQKLNLVIEVGDRGNIQSVESEPLTKSFLVRLAENIISSPDAPAECGIKLDDRNLYITVV